VLADDDKDHAILFQNVLMNIYPNGELIIIHNGEALLDFLREEDIDLLFLDLNLPCKHGFECLQEIRNELRLAELPVIIYSSSAYLPDIIMSYSKNANLYIVKPFTAEHLANALKSVFLNLDWIGKSTPYKYYFINNQFVPFTAATA
jgi:DNA-binding response OmpR family regulator